MTTVTIRRRLARLRHPARARRLALALWIVWAVVVWNVVLDHTIVIGGREYLYAAAMADAGRGPQVTMDAYMRPAVAHGVVVASVAAAAILLAGVAGVRAAARASRTS